MRNPLRRRGTIADLEAELARLIERKADAERRRSETLQAREEARALRVDSLGDDAETVEKANAAVRRLTAEADELEGVIEDFATAISAAEVRLTDAQDRERREAEASRLDAAAAAVERRSSDLAKAVNALAAVVKGIIKDVPSDVPLWSGTYAYRPEGRNVRIGDGVSVNEAVAGVVADALAATIPGIVDNWRDGGKNRSGIIRWLEPTAAAPTLGSYDAVTPPLSANDSLDTLIVSRLRKRAADIRGGEVAPGDGEIKPPAAPQPRKETPPEVHVFVSKPFSFVNGINAMGEPVLELVSAEWVRWVPEPVASAAVNRGLALRTDEPKGAAAFEAEKERRARPNHGYRSGPLRPEHCVTLGDVLGLEREWREEFVPLRSEEAEEAARAVG